MKYYSTQRPVVPGNFPEPDDNKVVAIHNYDSKTYCEAIGQKVWGYVEYEKPISLEAAIDFDLIPPLREIKKIRFVGIDSWDRMVFQDENGNIWKYTEPGEQPYERHERLHTSTNNDFDGEPCWPMSPDIDYQVKMGSGDMDLQKY